MSKGEIIELTDIIEEGDVPPRSPQAQAADPSAEPFEAGFDKDLEDLFGDHDAELDSLLAPTLEDSSPPKQEIAAEDLDSLLNPPIESAPEQTPTAADFDDIFGDAESKDQALDLPTDFSLDLPEEASSARSEEDDQSDIDLEALDALISEAEKAPALVRDEPVIPQPTAMAAETAPLNFGMAADANLLARLRDVEDKVESNEQAHAASLDELAKRLSTEFSQSLSEGVGSLKAELATISSLPDVDSLRQDILAEVDQRTSKASEAAALAAREASQETDESLRQELAGLSHRLADAELRMQDLSDKAAQALIETPTVNDMAELKASLPSEANLSEMIARVARGVLTEELQAPQAELTELTGLVNVLEHKIDQVLDPSVLENLASKDELASLATKNELAAFPTMADLDEMATKSQLGSLAEKSDLEALAGKDELAAVEAKLADMEARLSALPDPASLLSPEILQGFATKEDLAQLIPQSALADLVHRSELAAFEDKCDIETVATKDELALVEVQVIDLARKSELADFATKDELSLVETKLADAATKDDLTALATREELAELATKADLTALQDSLDPSLLATKDDLAELAPQSALADLASKNELADFATKDELTQLESRLADAPTKDELAALATREELTGLATKADLTALQDSLDPSLLATKDDLAELAPQSALADLASKNELADFATKDELTLLESRLADAATKDELAALATREELAELATKSDLTALQDSLDPSLLATKDELAELAPRSALADLASKSELAGFASKAEFDFSHQELIERLDSLSALPSEWASLQDSLTVIRNERALLVGKDDLAPLVTRDELSELKSRVAEMVTKDDLTFYAGKDELLGLASKADLDFSNQELVNRLDALSTLPSDFASLKDSLAVIRDERAGLVDKDDLVDLATKDDLAQLAGKDELQGLASKAELDFSRQDLVNRLDGFSALPDDLASLKDNLASVTADLTELRRTSAIPAQAVDKLQASMDRLERELDSARTKADQAAATVSELALKLTESQSAFDAKMALLESRLAALDALSGLESRLANLEAAPKAVTRAEMDAQSAGLRAELTDYVSKTAPKAAAAVIREEIKNLAQLMED